MITLIFNTYLWLFVTIGIALTAIGCIGFYTIIRLTTKQNLPLFDEISGEDHIETQLDLARAYIEMKQLKHAKKILKTVLAIGNTAQKKAARNLLQARETVCELP